jgi:hypothetical protein
MKYSVLFTESYFNSKFWLQSRCSLLEICGHSRDIRMVRSRFSLIPTVLGRINYLTELHAADSFQKCAIKKACAEVQQFPDGPFPFDNRISNDTMNCTCSHKYINLCFRHTQNGPTYDHTLLKQFMITQHRLKLSFS